MKSEDISCMSWEQQHIYGVKRMIYFYTQLAKKMKWDFTNVRTPEMEFLPRYGGNVCFANTIELFCWLLAYKLTR